MWRLLLFERCAGRLGRWLESGSALPDIDLPSSYLSARRLVRTHREQALEKSLAAAAHSHRHLERAFAPRFDDHLVDAAASEISFVSRAANFRISDFPRRIRPQLAGLDWCTGRRRRGTAVSAGSWRHHSEWGLAKRSGCRSGDATVHHRALPRGSSR